MISLLLTKGLSGAEIHREVVSAYSVNIMTCQGVSHSCCEREQEHQKWRRMHSVLMLFVLIDGRNSENCPQSLESHVNFDIVHNVLLVRCCHGEWRVSDGEAQTGTAGVLQCCMDSLLFLLSKTCFLRRISSFVQSPFRPHELQFNYAFLSHEKKNPEVCQGCRIFYYFQYIHKTQKDKQYQSLRFAMNRLTGCH